MTGIAAGASKISSSSAGAGATQLVSTGDAASESYRCVFRDLSTASLQPFNVQADLPVSKLFEIAGQVHHLTSDSYEVYFTPPSGDAIQIHPHDPEPIYAQSFMNSSALNRFKVTGKDGADPVREESPEEASGVRFCQSSKRLRASDGSALDALHGDIRNRGMGLGTNTIGSSTSTSNSYSSFYSKSSTGFAGLSNQGATCYLNSLLQTLYMTPEFRNAVYKWQSPLGGSTEPSSSIPFELQKLFMLLQTTNDKALETTAITKSFGWERAEAYQQHDVQELLRVLFEALGKRWGEEKINDLYQGEMHDFVKCKNCGHESIRKDLFLDVPLVLRAFGSSTVVKSVEEAMEKFTETELLSGDNQYFCEKCNEKHDALKGLKFSKFPYLLTLQLKRFDFDFIQMRRIKLNDKVSFPFVLDLNRFVQPSETGAEGAAAAAAADADNTGTPAAAAAAAAAEEGSQSVPTAGPAMSDPRAEFYNEILQKASGPHVYELFSIMIHSGSALGGHYYAYIMSFDDYKWYSFNDSSVTEVSKETVQLSFGGAKSSSSSYNPAYMSSMSAYMLIYRRIDPARNEKPMNSSTMPDHVKNLLDEIKEAERIKAEQELLAQKQTKLSIYYTGDPKVKATMKELNLEKTCTIRETTKRAWELWELQDTVSLERVRLRKYQPHSGQATDDFTGAEDTTLTEQRLVWGGSTLYLEQADESGAFRVFDEHDLTLDLRVYNQDTHDFEAVQRFTLNKKWTVKELRKAIAKEIGADGKDIQIAGFTTSTSPIKRIDGDKLMVDAYHLASHYKLFVDTLAGKEKASEWDQTTLYKAVRTLLNTIEIFVVLPDEPDDSQGHSVKVDQRDLFGAFKDSVLAPLAGLSSDEFQVHKLKSVSRDTKIQVSALSQQVKYAAVTGDPAKLWIKRGSPLKDGEVLADVFLFQTEAAKPLVPLMTIAIREKMTVLEVKEIIVRDAQEKARRAEAAAASAAAGEEQGEDAWKFSGLTFDVERLRFRSMGYQNSPKEVLFDTEQVVTTSYSYTKMRFVAQLLDGPDPKTKASDVVLYCRQWLPDAYSLGSFFELVVPKTSSPMDVARLLSERSGIPPEHIEMGQCPYEYSFPHEIPRNDIELKLKWEKSTTVVTTGYSKYYTDGYCLFFKDVRAKLKELSADEKTKAENEDKERCRGKTTKSYTARKEKALKIYDAGESSTSAAAAPVGVRVASV